MNDEGKKKINENIHNEERNSPSLLCSFLLLGLSFSSFFLPQVQLFPPMLYLLLCEKRDISLRTEIAVSGSVWAWFNKPTIQRKKRGLLFTFVITYDRKIQVRSCAGLEKKSPPPLSWLTNVRRLSGSARLSGHLTRLFCLKGQYFKP